MLRSSDAADPTVGQSWAELQTLFLGRLERLASMRALCYQEGYREPLRLIDHALYSTYRDCVRLGLRAEGRRRLGLPQDEQR